MKLEEKISLLKRQLSEYKKILIAFSGGVDSSLLLKVSTDVLGSKNIIAATADSPTYTNEELKEAKKLTKSLRVKHIIFKTKEFNDENFINNPPLRCYYCKKELFGKLEAIREKYNCDMIIDGANYDDRNDHRPGTKAENEFKIQTPLKDAFFTKQDIREYSRQLKLKTHDAPSMACLASRIPYGEKITRQKIKMIDAGEKFLKALGIRVLRLRSTSDTARIEVNPEDFNKILNNKNSIIKKLKKIGYKYITLDLEGFRSGSMNEVLKKSQKFGREK
jgi:uncharacterized protein